MTDRLVYDAHVSVQEALSSQYFVKMMKNTNESTIGIFSRLELEIFAECKETVPNTYGRLTIFEISIHNWCTLSGNEGS